MDELKATTFVAHARLQEAPFFEALVACQLPLESYVGQLRALTTIHGVVEGTLSGSQHPAIAAVWRDDLRKVPLLHQDLRYFEPRALADNREAVAETLGVADHLRLASLEQPLELLGWLYVLEGSTLGGQMLRGQYARAFRLPGEEGLAYLGSYGRAVPAHWAEFQQRMNGLSLTPEETAQILQAASGAFTRLKAIFQALYPFKPESKVYLVQSINPEAGRHPVPADPRELEAALRAADLCWEKFPYFAARYGERGRCFARSDGAWLATLGQFDELRIQQQVVWLARVLASRGMPTLLLQVQLEMLFAELSAARPEQRPDYEKLLAAASQLHAARRQQLSDEQIEDLASEFDRAVGPEGRARCPQAGLLLAAAVADEQSDYPGAVANLANWLTDPTRFPADWIAAVQATLAQAKAQASLQR